MSHFSVAVLSDGTKTVEELLAPYQEYGCEPMYDDRYLVFHDTRDEYREDWETGSLTVYYKDGSLYGPSDEVFREPGSPKWRRSSDDFEVPAGLPMVKVPHKLIWPDFDKYLVEYVGEEVNEKTGEIGYWENPDAHWDWWTEGGRFTEYAKLCIGATTIRVGDIHVDRDMLREEFAKDYDEMDDWHRELSAHGMTRDEYVETNSRFTTWAVITPDGEWHEHDAMGWWGLSSTTKESATKWADEFESRFLSDPDLMLTVVDCHI